MKLRKLFAVTVLSIFSLSAYAKTTLTDYAALVATLKNGDTVHAVIDVDKCTFANGGSNTWGLKTRGFRIDDIYEGTTADTATGKKMAFIASSTHDYVGNNKVGINIARSLFRVFENGNVEVIDQIFSMETAKYDEKTTMLCHLSQNGAGGVLLTSK